MKTMVFCSAFCRRDELILHAGADQRIEGGEGLVHEQDVGIERERPRQPDALLLAARQLPRLRVLVAGETDDLDPFGRLVQPGLALDTAHLEPVGDVVEHGAMRQQPEPLEHHRRLVSAELAQFGRSTSGSTFTPSTTISPEVGSISRLMWRISVDLPEPDSPITTWILPAGIEMLMSLRPRMWPCLLPIVSLGHARSTAPRARGSLPKIL